MRKLRSKIKYEEKIEELVAGYGLNQRKIIKNGTEVLILYMPVITDRENLSNSIIKPIIDYAGEEKISIELLWKSILYLDDLLKTDDFNAIVDYVYQGYSIICIPDEQDYLVANTFRVEKRSISAPELQTSIRGPRDAFTENLESNLSLIRYRLKDSSLKIDTITVGSRTKTPVVMVYIVDIANPELVKCVRAKLEQIVIDGVFESGYIQKMLTKNNFDIFPNIGVLERSDSACASVIQGKICILVEGSNLALVVPKVFTDFLDAGDDHYDNIYISVFNKIIRLVALFVTLTFSSLYVSVVGFQSDILPAQYILALAVSRVTVPANALVEAVLMEFVAEMLKEASIRLPKQIGPAIGIVGTIVIGQAAVAAGLVSPLMVIIISLVTMSSFIAPDYTIMHPIRLLKYPLLFLTSVFGLFGFVLGLTVIAIQLVNASSFGVPYFAPMTPFIFRDFKNFILSDIRLSKLRPEALDDVDETKK